MSVAAVATYFAGQCTAYVAQVLDWVEGGWGNAWQWFGNAQKAGFQTGSVPLVGAVAVWGPDLPGSGGAGHVAAVTAVQPSGSFQVSEQNYSCGPFCTDSRNVPAGGGGDFLGFIYPKGASVPQLDSASPGDILGGAATGGVLGSALTGQGLLDIFPTLLDQGAKAFTGGVNAAVTNFGHGAASALTTELSNAGTFLMKNVVALAVAMVVVVALFVL